MSKIDIINLAINLANIEFNRAATNQNLAQMAEMRRLARRLQQILDEV